MNAERATSGVNEADRARADLYDTLGQLRDRLNYAQRVDDAVDRAKARIVVESRENPLRFAAGAAAVATTVGLAVWGIAKFVTSRFD